MPINADVQNNYDQLMENTQDARLQAISKEIDELVKDENTSNDKIDFNQIMDESLNIGKENATKIINYINELLENGFGDNKDLNDLKTYLTPLAAPANNTIHESFTQDRTGVQEINLKDRTLSDWLNNRDYGLNRRMNSIISRIGNNENLQNLKTNIMFIKDICDGKKASRSDFDRIKNYLISNIDQRTTTTEIAGEAQPLDREFSVNNNEDVRKVFLLLNQFLIETNNHLDDISNANNVREQINQERRSANAAINKFITRDFLNNSSNTGDYQVWNYFPELDDNETDKIKDYIKESASDNVDNSTKKDILSTYRKYLTYTSEVPPYGNNLNQIKETVEAEYKEVGIINDFIENFINNGKDFNTDLEQYLDGKDINKDDFTKLLTLYIENDGSQNPDIVSYYRNNLAGEQANNIEEHYPEIQETIQSIDKLTQINKVNNFSKLSNEDISNITKYIESTKNLNASEGTPKRDILKYYNDHIKGKKGEGTHRDTDNFDAIKDAIEGTKEGQEGYRKEIVQKELTELYRQLPDLINRNFDDAIIKGYRDNPENICIFNEAEFNAFRDREKTRREDTESTNNINTLKGALTETAISNFINQEYGKGITEIIAQKGNINYDNVFNSIKSGANQALFESLNGPEKDQVQKHRTLKLNQAMFNKSKEFINNFDCNSINTRYLYGIETSAINTSIKAKLTGDDEIKINHINNPEEQQKKLYKAQKIDYILKSLQNPGNGSHKDGFDNIKPLQKEIGVTDDGKFGKDTLSSAERRINQ